MNQHAGKRWMLASTVAAFAAVAVLAHEGDEKLRDWRPPVEAPIWRADDPGTAFAPPTFRSSGITLASWLPVKAFHPSGTSASDCWGYESPSGREYAILGHSHGTAIVDITQPGSATIVIFLNGPVSVWRNVKTYGHHLYAVSEGGGGIQVFDLANVDSGVVPLVNTIDATAATPATHTMLINEQTGFLYRLGGGSFGVRAYDLRANPAAPAFVGSWSVRYIHDGAVRSVASGPWAGREILFACGGLSGGYGDTRLEILDVTNKSAITSIGSCSYPQAKYCHGIAISDDLQTGWINDEMDEQNGQYSRGITVNLADLTRPVMAGSYTTGERTVDHNNYARGNRLYCSNYTSGLQVFDVSDPIRPVRVAWFDTYPEDDGSVAATYNGLWSNYPYFRSGTIIGSDINRGLVVLRQGDPAGVVRAAVADGGWFDPTGHAMEVRLESLRPGAALVGIPRVVGSVAGVAFRNDLEPVSDGLYLARFPSGSCGAPVRWSIEFPLADGAVLREPAAGQFEGSIGLGEQVMIADDCEASTGWTAGVTGDTATAGLWTNAVPVGSPAQASADHTPSGVNCWVTGNGPVGGTSAFTADVDGGRTTLVTPDYPIAGLGEPMLTYWRWYTNSLGGIFSGSYIDTLEVSVSANGGATWLPLESVQDTGLGWNRARFRLRDVLPAGSTAVRVRFVAADLGTDSAVEAAIDDLLISDALCTEMQACDLDRSREVDLGDVMMVLLEWGPATDGRADLDRSGFVDLGDVALVLMNQGPLP